MTSDSIQEKFNPIQRTHIHEAHVSYVTDEKSVFGVTFSLEIPGLKGLNLIADQLPATSYMVRFQSVAESSIKGMTPKGQVKSFSETETNEDYTRYFLGGEYRSVRDIQDKYQKIVKFGKLKWLTDQTAFREAQDILKIAKHAAGFIQIAHGHCAAMQHKDVVLEKNTQGLWERNRLLLYKDLLPYYEQPVSYHPSLL